MINPVSSTLHVVSLVPHPPVKPHRLSTPTSSDVAAGRQRRTRYIDVQRGTEEGEEERCCTAAPRAGWISIMLLGWLRNAVHATRPKDLPERRVGAGGRQPGIDRGGDGAAGEVPDAFRPDPFAPGLAPRKLRDLLLRLLLV